MLASEVTERKRLLYSLHINQRVFPTKAAQLKHKYYLCARPAIRDRYFTPVYTTHCPTFPVHSDDSFVVLRTDRTHYRLPTTADV